MEELPRTVQCEKLNQTECEEQEQEEVKKQDEDTKMQETN